MGERTLPNGKVIDGVPDSISDEQWKQFAIKKGWATEEEFASAAPTDPSTGADLLSFGGELAGGIAGAKYGAAAGTAIAPGVGTFIGGLIGGAIGAGTGYFAGEALESNVEQRKLDVDQALRGAGEAAVMDAVFGGIGAAVGKGLSAVAKPLIAKFTGNRAVQKIVLPNGEEIVKLSDEVGDIAKTEALQAKLMEEGGTLLPSQVGGASLRQQAAETYLESSIIGGDIVGDIVRKQDDYVSNQVLELVDIFGKDAEYAFKSGEALQNMVKGMEKAVKANYAPMYAQIDELGKISMDMRPMREAVKDSSKLSLVARREVTAVQKAITASGQSLTPAEATKLLADVKGMGLKTKEGRAAVKRLEGYLAEQGKAKNFVQLKNIKKKAEVEKYKLVNKRGQTGLQGSEKAFVNRIGNMRDNMSFSEAHLELSYLKSLQRDLAAQVDKPNSKLSALLASTITDLEKSMDKAAKSFSPELRKLYRTTADGYKKNLDTIYGGYLGKIMKKDPEKVGETLWATGNVTSMKQLDKAFKLADDLGMDTITTRNGVMQGFLDTAFKGNDIRSVEVFAQRMRDPKFVRTFNKVFESRPDVVKRTQTLVDEVEILTKRLANRGDSASSLAVRSREIGAATNTSVVQKFAYALIPEVLRGRLSGAEMTKSIAALKQVSKAIEKGEPVSKSVLNYIAEKLPEMTAYSAAALGAAGRPEPAPRYQEPAPQPAPQQPQQQQPAPPQAAVDPGFLQQLQQQGQQNQQVLQGMLTQNKYA